MDYQFAQPVSGNQNLNRMQEQKQNEEQEQVRAEYGIEKMTKNNMPNNDFIQFGVESIKPYAQIVAEVLAKNNIHCKTTFNNTSYESKPQIFVSKGQGRDSVNNAIFNGGVSLIDNGIKLQIQLDDTAIKTHALDEPDSKAVLRISTYSFAAKQSNTEITPNLQKVLDVLEENGLIRPEHRQVLQNAKVIGNEAEKGETVMQNQYQEQNQQLKVGVSKSLKEYAEDNPEVKPLFQAAQNTAYKIAAELQQSGIQQPNTIWVNIKERQGQYGKPVYDVSLSMKDTNGTSLYMNFDIKSLQTPTPKFYRVSTYPQNASVSPTLQAIQEKLQQNGYIGEMRSQQQQQPKLPKQTSRTYDKPYTIRKETFALMQSDANIKNNVIPVLANFAEKLSESMPVQPHYTTKDGRTGNSKFSISVDYKKDAQGQIETDNQGNPKLKATLSISDQISDKNSTLYLNISDQSIKNGSPKVTYTSYYPKGTPPTETLESLKSILEQNGYMWKKEEPIQAAIHETPKAKINISKFVDMQDKFIADGVKAMQSTAEQLNNQLQQNGIHANLTIFVQKVGQPPAYQAKLMSFDENEKKMLNLYASDKSVKDGKPTFYAYSGFDLQTRQQEDGEKFFTNKLKSVIDIVQKSGMMQSTPLQNLTQQYNNNPEHQNTHAEYHRAGDTYTKFGKPTICNSEMVEILSNDGNNQAVPMIFASAVDGSINAVIEDNRNNRIVAIDKLETLQLFDGILPDESLRFSAEIKNIPLPEKEKQTEQTAPQQDFPEENIDDLEQNICHVLNQLQEENFQGTIEEIYAIVSNSDDCKGITSLADEQTLKDFLEESGYTKICTDFQEEHGNVGIELS